MTKTQSIVSFYVSKEFVFKGFTMKLDQASVDFITSMEKGGATPFHKMNIDEVRSMPTIPPEMFGEMPQVYSSETKKLPVEGAEIDLHIIKPQEITQGILVYYHGGGWVVGDVGDAMFQITCKNLANKTNLTVVMVNYRKAPENPFPTAIDDAYAALSWVNKNIIYLSGQRVPILVGGDSAGGNISAVIAHKAKDLDGPAIALQILIYPVTSDDFTNSSYTDPECQTALLSGADMEWFWNHYIPDLQARKNPYAAPIYAENFKNLPPAIVITAGLDPLRDEAEDYVSKLVKAGVEVVFKRYSDQLHAFFTFPNILPRSEELQEYLASHINLFLKQNKE